MPDEYKLTIYEPGSITTCMTEIRSNNPFMRISKGDLINPIGWPDATTEILYKVINVIHAVYEIDGTTKHIVEVMTMEIENTGENYQHGVD